MSEHKNTKQTHYFDVNNQIIFRGNELIQLSSKGFAVLEYLYKYPGQLITKEELLDNVWKDSFTVEAVLKNAISEIRKALNDNPRRPSYVQTVHRRGYRFIGAELLPVKTIASQMQQESEQNLCNTNKKFAGRERQLETISNAWQQAQKGKCQQIIINGDPGVGKTALVTHWLDLVSQNDSGRCLIVKSRCTQSIKQFAYITLLDFIYQACRSKHSNVARELLCVYCPDIFNKLFVSAGGAELTDSCDLSSRLTRQQELPVQISGFLEEFTRHTAILWSIDDAGHCDRHTNALIDYLSTTSNISNFMVLMSGCDWQSPEKISGIGSDVLDHRSDTVTQMIRVPFLDESEIRDFVSCHVAPQEVTPGLIDRVYTLSAGHPMIAKELLESFSSNNSTGYVSTQFQQRLGTELQKLDSEHCRLLQTASVVVVDEFSAAAVASLLNAEIVDTEDACEALVLATGWIQRTGTRVWPDGTAAQLYKFSHKIYRDLLYQTLSAAKKRSLHLRHAERLELAYQEHVDIIASNLLYHYRQAGCERGIKRYRERAENNQLKQLQTKVNLQPQYHHAGSQDSKERNFQVIRNLIPAAQYLHGNC